MKQFSITILWIVATCMVLSPCVEAGMMVLESTCHQEAKSGCCKKTQPQKTTLEAGSESGHCQKHSNEDHSQCNSMCHCSCCGHVASAFLPAMLAVFYEPAFREMPVFRKAYHFDYQYAIWQPPRRV